MLLVRKDARLRLWAAAVFAVAAAATALPASSLAKERFDFVDEHITVSPHCGPGAQYYEFVDDNGADSYYTYANGSQSCVSVDWSFAPLATNQWCAVFFYVPYDNATAILPFGLSDDHGNYGYYHLDESNTSNFRSILVKPKGVIDPINHVHFSDNNGQQYPTMIGWQHNQSLLVECEDQDVTLSG
jgi:hypothetical protein